MLSDLQVETYIQQLLRNQDKQDLQYKGVLAAIAQLQVGITALTNQTQQQNTFNPSLYPTLDSYFTPAGIVHRLKHIFNTFVDFLGTVSFPNLAASRPLKLNSTFEVLADKIDLAAPTTDIKNTLGVPNGGTGAATLTSKNLIVGNGVGAVTFVPPSTAGYVLTDNGVGVIPSFQANTAGSISAFTPILSFGGATTGITYATQLGYCAQFNGFAVAFISVVLTSKGSATGNVLITGLPVGCSLDSAGDLGVRAGFTLIGSPVVIVNTGTNSISLYNNAAAAVASLTDVNFTNTSSFIITVAYKI